MSLASGEQRLQRQLRRLGILLGICGSTGMKQYPTRAFISVKRMGELDIKRFHEITKRKFLGKDADLKAAQLCSIWEHHRRDPNWHPFNDATRENGSKEIIIDDNDERLNRLKHEFGQAAYDLVTTALMEMNEGSVVDA